MNKGMILKVFALNLTIHGPPWRRSRLVFPLAGSRLVTAKNGERIDRLFRAFRTRVSRNYGRCYVRVRAVPPCTHAASAFGKSPRPYDSLGRNRVRYTRFHRGTGIGWKELERTSAPKRQSWSTDLKN